MKTFKVRVTGAGDGDHWYSEKIGEVFSVRGSDRNMYLLTKGHKGIMKSDCVIVEDFKVGDRVRVKDECVGKEHRYPKDGGNGTIIGRESVELDWRVHLDKQRDRNDWWSYRESELILLEDEMEYTVNGVTYRQLKDITVKALILAGAPDRMVDDVSYTGHSVMYPCSEAIPLKKICDCFSPDWLVAQGFVEVVEEALKACPFCGGEAHWQTEKRDWIACSDCKIETNVMDSTQEAISLWNKRV